MAEGTPLLVQVGEYTLPTRSTYFSTGSHGWQAFGKVIVEGVECQVQTQIVATHSASAAGLKAYAEQQKARAEAKAAKEAARASATKARASKAKQ